ncbi:MAG: class II aldolase/adducin family protein [Betaproteobacteria bacterium]|nr:class II aldolase/adducin family protein [Betaproteobacteria bacterium]
MSRPPFYERTVISPNDDFKAVGPALGNKHVAIVIPWHGLIAVGRSIGEAVAPHVIYDCMERMDVTLPESAPTMPYEQCTELRKMMIERSDYVNEMRQVVRRRGKTARNASCVVPVQ